MRSLPFKTLILLQPLGLLYGSSGRLLSPETLTGRATVLSRRVSTKRPEMGILKMKFELLNVQGELKAEIIGVQFMKVRNP